MHVLGAGKARIATSNCMLSFEALLEDDQSCMHADAIIFCGDRDPFSENLESTMQL
jgi:hypothetical protein